MAQHAHHNAYSINYQSHVLTYKDKNFCIGCLSSRLFLTVILPILIATIIYPSTLISPLIDWSVFLFLWLISTSIYVYELFTGNLVQKLSSKIAINLYFFGSIMYSAVVPSQISSTTSLFLLILLAMPQILVYAYKIVTKKEFNFIKTKFLIRISFITAFFFSLLNFQQDVLAHVVVIFIGSYIFIKFRSFSSYRVDPEGKMVSAIIFHNNSFIGKIISKLKIFNPDGNVKFANFDKNSPTSKIYFVFLISILYLFGLIVTKNTEVCSSDISQSGSLAIPWVAMSSGSTVYCSKCGTENAKESTFCTQCGNQIPTQNYQQQPSQGYQQQPQHYQQQPQGGYQRGYQDPSYGRHPQSRGGHRKREHNKSIPIILAVVIGFIALIVTGNFIFAVIIGAVAFIGVYMAMSTNNPCLSYCIMSSCCNCICSAMNAETRRR